MAHQIEDLDGELRRVLRGCEEDGLTREQMRAVFAPLVAHFITATAGEEPLGAGKRCGWLAIILLAVVVVLVLATITTRENGAPPPPAGLLTSLKSELTSKILVLLRLLLVNLQPHWNWAEVYYSRCLVPNPYYDEGGGRGLKEEDCNLCEQLDPVIPTLQNPTQSEAREYLQTHRPFIVRGAMTDWPGMVYELYFDNITDLYSEPRGVCNLSANLRRRDSLNLIQNLYKSKSWFAHWENCGKSEAKSLRRFYRRPHFLSASLDFTGPNWVLLSSDYSARVYKSLEVGAGLSLLYQFRGENLIRLRPKDSCRAQCPELSGVLGEGELLVTEHFIWGLEYVPGEGMDNLALLSEVEWGEEV